MSMTYPKTLLFFVVPAIVVMAIVTRKKIDRPFLSALGVLLVVVYVATSPWDNLAVRWGIWFFDWEKTAGIRIGYLPLEEYLFFGLQTVLAALVYLHFRRDPEEAVAGALGRSAAKGSPARRDANRGAEHGTDRR
jgi:lycopene cyclase domain-containing protein